MRDPIDEAFGRLESEIVRQTRVPNLSGIVHTARRRQRTRMAGVAIGAVWLAGSAGLLATETAPNAVGPAHDSGTSDGPTTHTESPTDVADPVKIPDQMWMRADDLSTSEFEWTIEDLRPVSAVADLPTCMRNWLGIQAVADKDQIRVREAVVTAPEGAVGARIHHYVMPADKFETPVEDDVPCAQSNKDASFINTLGGGATLYGVELDGEVAVLAVSSTTGFVSLAYFVGDPTTGGAPTLLDLTEPTSVASTLMSIVVKINPAPVDDPYMATEIPDGVWLEQDDLRTVADQEWSVAEPTDGVMEDRPLCPALQLRSVDGVKHQRATTADGDVIDQYAYLATAGSIDPGAFIEECGLEVELINGWDGTMSSATVRFVLDETQPYMRSYWLAISQYRSGVVLTVYHGPTVEDGYPYSSGTPGLPTAEDYAEADLTLAMRDLAGHSDAFRRAYIDACFEAGERLTCP